MKKKKEVLAPITTSTEQVETQTVRRQMLHSCCFPSAFFIILVSIGPSIGLVSTAELYNIPVIINMTAELPVIINTSRTGPKFSQSSDPLRYVKVSCQDCFIIEDFNIIRSLEISEWRASSAEFKSLQAVLKDQGLNPSLEVNAPIDPCCEHSLRLTVTYEREGERGIFHKVGSWKQSEVGNRSVFAAYKTYKTYGKGVCISSTKGQNNLSYVGICSFLFFLIFTFLFFLIFTFLLRQVKICTRKKEKGERLIDSIELIWGDK